MTLSDVAETDTILKDIRYDKEKLGRVVNQLRIYTMKNEEDTVALDILAHVEANLDTLNYKSVLLERHKEQLENNT